MKRGPAQCPQFLGDGAPWEVAAGSSFAPSSFLSRKLAPDELTRVTLWSDRSLRIVPVPHIKESKALSPAVAALGTRSGHFVRTAEVEAGSSPSSSARSSHSPPPLASFPHASPGLLVGRANRNQRILASPSCSQTGSLPSSHLLVPVQQVSLPCRVPPLPAWAPARGELRPPFRGIGSCWGLCPKYSSSLNPFSWPSQRDIF